MFKVGILLALAIASVVAQEGPAPSSEAAAEPYSYGYQTDSHAASEQRDPQGRVTGFYTLTDADGRERRVEYTADESGFKAKIATNEVGTKSENPADVEIQASEPTQGQFVYQSQAQQVQYQQAPPVVRQQVVTQQRVATVQPQVSSQVQYFQQQQPQTQTVTYGNYPAGYGYGNAAYGNTAYGTGYGSGYGYRSGYYGVSGYGVPSVGNYNNHLPSQYYRSVSTSSTGPATYTVGGQNVRYVSQPGVTTTGVRTVSYPGAVSYGASYNVPAGVTTTTRTTSSNSQGSSNYLVLQKRAAEQKNN